MAFMKGVEIRVRKSAPIEALKGGRIESNSPSHPPVHPQKIRPTGSAPSRTTKTQEPIVISSPEAPPPKQGKSEKAKPSVRASKPNKRKAEVLESPEKERRPAKSLAIPLKFHKKKSAPSSFQDDKKVHSPEVGPQKSHSSLTSRAQVPSIRASPHSIQYDEAKKIVQEKPIFDPFSSAKGRANSSASSDKKAKEKSSNSSVDSDRPKKKVKRATADPEDTRSLKISTVRNGVERNVLEDEDSDVPIRIGRRKQNPLPILINGEVYLPPKLGEGTARRPTKEAMRKAALDRFALRLKLAKSDFLALCRSRGGYPTRKELDMRAFPKDFQFEPSNQNPSIPRSPKVERRNVTQAEAAYAFLTGNWSPGGADIENMPKRSSRKKKKNPSAKAHEALRKEEPKARKKTRDGDSH